MSSVSYARILGPVANVSMRERCTEAWNAKSTSTSAMPDGRLESRRLVRTRRWSRLSSSECSHWSRKLCGAGRLLDRRAQRLLQHCRGMDHPQRLELLAAAVDVELVLRTHRVTSARAAYRLVARCANGITDARHFYTTSRDTTAATVRSA